MILATRKLRNAFLAAYNTPRAQAVNEKHRLVYGLDAALCELQDRMESIRLTEEERSFVRRMEARASAHNRIDQLQAAFLAVIMSRLGQEEAPPEGRHRS